MTDRQGASDEEIAVRALRVAQENYVEPLRHTADYGIGFDVPPKIRGGFDGGVYVQAWLWIAREDLLEPGEGGQAR